MPLAALPPDRPVAAFGKTVRPQLAVEGGVPLPHEPGILALQIVEPRPRLLPRAVGTARPLHTAENHRLIAVPKSALPPDPLLTALRHLAGRQRAVFLSVPLRRKLRVGGCQIRLPGDRLLPRAVGAPAAPDQRGGQRLPRVAAVAAPPEFPVGAGHHLCGGEASVAPGVPELCHLRMAGGKIVFPRQQPLPAAVGTAPAEDRAGTDRAAPPVVPGAAPPDLAVAAAEHIPGRQRPVALRVPLHQQFASPRLLRVFT